MATATASQLRHILMKILPSPEMVAQGKAFGISNHLEMVRDSLWVLNSFLMDGACRELEQPDVAEWMKDVGVAVEHVHSLFQRILDYWQPREEEEGKKKRKMGNFFHPSSDKNIRSMSIGRAILVELKETTCSLNCLVNRGTAFGLRVEMMDSMDPSRDDYSVILDEEVMGRDEDEDQIIELLQRQQCDEDGNVPFVIAISGPKIYRKATLARKIYHHTWVRQHFQHRIWLDASSFRDLNSDVIAEEIAKLLTGKPCRNINCWPLINEYLGEDRYLLILENLYMRDVFKYKWEELNLNLLHCGAPGSKVILTVDKFEKHAMKFYVKEYKLNELPEDA